MPESKKIKIEDGSQLQEDPTEGEKSLGNAADDEQERKVEPADSGQMPDSKPQKPRKTMTVC
jgi:hypothetical protein